MPFTISTFPWYQFDDHSTSVPFRPGDLHREPARGTQNIQKLSATDHITRRTTIAELPISSEGSFQLTNKEYGNTYYTSNHEEKERTDDIDEETKSNKANDRIWQYFEDQINGDAKNTETGDHATISKGGHNISDVEEVDMKADLINDGGKSLTPAGQLNKADKTNIG